mgnify:CR=1 FL=1
MVMNIRTVAVIGSGTMGAGIAEVAASHGHQGLIYDIAAAAISHAIDGIRQRLASRVTRGKLSADASDQEKEAAYRFLAYLAKTESAQTFAGFDGAPSCINGVKSNDQGITAMVDLINAGETHDWMGSTIKNNITTDLNSVVQGFWADKNIENVLIHMKNNFGYFSPLLSPISNTRNT